MLTISKPSRQIMTYIVLLVVVALAGLYSNAVAMRCGTKLVEPGDNQNEVAVKCGEPTFVEQNRWHYNLGPHTFIKILHFTGGELQLIENGEYGGSHYGPAPPSVTP